MERSVCESPMKIQQKSAAIFLSAVLILATGSSATRRVGAASPPSFPILLEGTIVTMNATRDVIPNGHVLVRDAVTGLTVDPTPPYTPYASNANQDTPFGNPFAAPLFHDRWYEHSAQGADRNFTAFLAGGPQMSRKGIATLFVTVGALATFGLQPHAQGGKNRTEIATFSTLPSLRGAGPSQALGIDDAGTVIVGSSWDRHDALHAVKWSLQNGSWVITSLPYGMNANSAIARSVNNQGDAAGNDFPGSTSQPVLWPATGGFNVLGCGDAVGPATVNGISAAAQSLVGQQGGAASVWQPGELQNHASVTLQRSFGGRVRRQRRRNDRRWRGRDLDMSTPSVMPVRWTLVGGQWQIEQLDTRPGWVYGANGVGDLAGNVSFPCALADGCNRAVIWYAAGGSFELGTLGGEHSWARDINGSGEVVGWTRRRVSGRPASSGLRRAASAAAAVQRTLCRREWRKRRATGRHASGRRHELAGRRSRVGRSRPLVARRKSCRGSSVTRSVFVR